MNIDDLMKYTSDLHHRKIEAIRELANLATMRHYWCDDSYYSCPATEEGCSNPAYDGTNDCRCGADKHNEKVSRLLQILNVYEEPTNDVDVAMVVDCPDCGGGDSTCLYCDGEGTVIE